MPKQTMIAMPDDVRTEIANRSPDQSLAATVSEKMIAAVMMNNSLVLAVAEEGKSATAATLRTLAARVDAGHYSLPPAQKPEEGGAEMPVLAARPLRLTN